MIEDIEAGKHDGDLEAIVEACRERSKELDRRFGWRITLDGETWDEDSILLEEMEFVERVTGLDWPSGPLVSAKVAKAFLLAHWHKALGVELDEAFDKIKGLGAKAMIAAVSEYETAAGKDQPAPAT
jgi:hypothetical protein